MAKNKRKIIREMLFEVYDKGVKNEECNLDFYYEKILQALNIPFVSKCAKCNAEYERGIEDGKIIAEHGTVNWID